MKKKILAGLLIGALAVIPTLNISTVEAKSKKVQNAIEQTIDKTIDNQTTDHQSKDKKRPPRPDNQSDENGQPPEPPKDENGNPLPPPDMNDRNDQNNIGGKN